MKDLLKLIFILFFSLTLTSVYSQFWPISPMVRFANTVYCPIDSLALHDKNNFKLTFGKAIEDRYVDIIMQQDSIGISISDTIVYFNQKIRKEPKCYRKILFYNRRPLLNPDLKITFLKIIDYSEKEIIARATLRGKNSNNTFKRRETVMIRNEDITGVFLGTGKEYRLILSGVIVVSVGCGLIL